MLAVTLLSTVSAALPATLRPEALEVNRAPAAGVPPIVDGVALHFAWRVGCSCEDGGDHCCRVARAEAYRVQVHAVDDGGALYLDTGRVASTTTWHVATGARLPSDARFEWAVTVWPAAAADGAEGATERGGFQTALAQPADWNGAEWIGGFTQARASFALRAGATVVGATAYASGLGCFALTLNGQQVADSMMDPGWSTLPPMRLLYRAYNVSHLLVPGENSAGVRLGFCHYGGIDQPFCIDGHAMRDTCRGFVMRLSVRYADGETQDVLTTARGGGGGVQWNGTTKGNPMVYTHLYHGEVVTPASCRLAGTSQSSQ